MTFAGLFIPLEEQLKKEKKKKTLLEVGETALGFFFLILIPGTGAELSASRKPRLSIANGMNKQNKTHLKQTGKLHKQAKKKSI